MRLGKLVIGFGN